MGIHSRPMRLAGLALLLLVGVVHVSAEYAGASSEPVKALAADAPSEQAKPEVEPLDGKAALVKARKVAVDRFAQAEEHKKAAEVELAQAKQRATRPQNQWTLLACA